MHSADTVLHLFYPLGNFSLKLRLRDVLIAPNDFQNDTCHQHFPKEGFNSRSVVNVREDAV